MSKETQQGQGHSEHQGHGHKEHDKHSTDDAKSKGNNPRAGETPKGGTAGGSAESGTQGDRNGSDHSKQ